MANNYKAVSTTATSRLKQDYMRLLKDPVPYVRACPLPSNILVWYYIVTGPEKTPYQDGVYLGKLVFPNEFPFKPPAIYMITPNGRFKVNQKLCLSISDFHPDTWNPAWSVSTILTGLLSFMVENTPTSGSTESSEQTKRNLARDSRQFNLNDKHFCELFPEQAQEMRDSLSKSAPEQVGTETHPVREQLSSGRQVNASWTVNLFTNLLVMVGLTLFAYVVKHVFNTDN